MKKCWRKLVCILPVFSLLLGCTSQRALETSMNKEISPYISITETVYLDEAQTEMESLCSVYNCKEKKLTLQGTVPYTSGYPLTTYSTTQDHILYTALSERGDQLYENSDGNTIQLTDQLCALNHVVQCGNQLFLAGKYLDKYCIEPNIFDLTSGKLEKVFPDKNDDRFTWAVTCDPKENTVYFSYYSDNLSRGLLDEFNAQNHTELTDVPESPPSTICSLNMNTEKITPVYQTDDNIWGIAVSERQLYYCGSKSALSPKEDHKCYVVDLKTQQKAELSLPVQISGQMAIWDNVLYCLGWKDDVRGIYAINLATNDAELIYDASEAGFINGFSLNY